MEERRWAYRRRQPEGMVLYEAVRDNLATLLADMPNSSLGGVSISNTFAHTAGSRESARWRHHASSTRRPPTHPQVNSPSASTHRSMRRLWSMTAPMSSGPKRRTFDLNEQIVDRLHDLVSKYPKGLGLVKEFLQNADDAGASFLRVFYDRRRHSGTLPDPAMEVALGPALLFVNDRQFTREDLQHIQTISNSAKLHDAGRTGRFGQGFNTSYSVSDHPSLVTADTIAWFDPHRRIQNREKNAYAWELSDVAREWPAWVATFAPANVDRHGTPFEGAAFRLPLRTPEAAARSKIKKEAFFEADWEEILAQLRAAGPALLVFLRSVLLLEAYEILPSGEARLRARIRTRNDETVRAARAPLRNVIAGRPSELIRTWLESDEALPSAAFEHQFAIEADGVAHELETWEVVTELARGHNNVLLREALHLCDLDDKVIPWAGAAWRREGKSSLGKGGFACFLPLPEADQVPVWLHGWFSIDSARRGLARTPDVDALARHRVQWNRLLLEHGVGPAWAKLVMRLRGDSTSNTRPYELWPRELDQRQDIDRALSAGFYVTAKELSVFRVRRDAFAWQSLTTDLWDLPADWHERLEAPFRASQIPVTDPPLPQFIRRALKTANCEPNHLTPDLMRKSLRGLVQQGPLDCPLANAPSPWLSQPAWVLALAQFCSSDGREKLAGLPLALLPGGWLRCFATNDAVYIASKEGRRLLEPLPRRTLDTEFQHTVFNDRPFQAIGARSLDVVGMLEVAREVVAQSKMSLGWLQVFFEMLEQAPPKEVMAQKEQLKSLPLVPGPGGTYWPMGQLETPLLRSYASPQLLQALAQLGVPLVEGPKELLAAIDRFASRHQEFVKPPTPLAVVSRLLHSASQPGLKWVAFDAPATREPLLDLLASVDWTKEGVPFREKLRALPILPTLSGGRVAAQEPGVYTPGGLSPPAGITSSMSLLDLGPGERWRPLAAGLGVGTLDGFRFVQEILLPSFEQAPQELQDKLLVWLRDDFPRLEADLKQEQRLFLRDCIRNTPILPVRGGFLAAPARVYAPDVSEPDELLGPLARKPDPRRFAAQRDLWNRFFNTLELPRLPLASDLYEAVLAKTREANTHGVRAIRDELLQLATHIDHRWTDLERCEVAQGLTFGSALRGLAWLPARRVGTGDYAAALVPEERLYRASELATYRIRHLVASRLPVLDGRELSKGMAEGIGLRLQARPEEVLAHFDQLRREPLPQSEKALATTQKSFLELLRHFGSREEGLEAALPSWLSSRKSEPLILVGRRWWRPARVFLRHLSLSLPGATSIHDDPDFARSVESHGIRHGLERLGVRETPTPEDWLAVLDDLARQHGDKPLPDEPLRVARGALRELRGADPRWLDSQTVWILTRDRRLARARDAFLSDDPRLSSEAPASLALVEDIQDVLEVARHAGARSLRGALRDQLHEETFESVAAEHRKWRSKHERRVRSKAFHDALCRVAYEEALRERNPAPHAVADEERLGRVRGLRIRIAERLRVQSVLTPEGAPVIFDHEAPRFFDESTETLWLLATKARKMLDELVRAVAKRCAVSDTLTISRLLGVQPEQMQAVLDEDGIAIVPTGRELIATDLVSHEEAQEPNAFIPQDGELDWGDEDERPDNTQGGDENLAPGVEAGDSGTWMGEASPSSGFSLGGARRESSGTARNRSARMDVLGSAPLLDPDVPRPLSHGSSNPWDPNLPSSFWGGGFSGMRLRTYTHPTPLADYDTGSADHDAMSGANVQKAALAQVCEYELKRGRTTAQADGTLDGFDLISNEGAEKRLIKVRGIDGPWTARGVGLTRREFDTSLREGDQWWLYVVEHALDPLRASVRPLRNPLRGAAEFRLGHEWRAISEGAKDAATPGEAPAVGETVELEEGRTAKVLEVEHFDSICEVVLEFPDGTTLSQVWRPSWKRRA